MTECIFCKIINKEIPAALLYEDRDCIVILDKFPASEGQSLVIAKTHNDYLFALPEKSYSSLLLTSKKIVHAIDATFSPLRTCLVVEGFEVPHCHIKLFPSYHTKLQMHGSEASMEELQKIAEKLKKNLLAQ